MSSMPSTTPETDAGHHRGHRARRQARRHRHPPGAAAQLHRRAPRRAVPLPLRALRRAHRQPAADVPARAQPGLPRRLVAGGRLPRQRLRPHARAAARRAQGRLRDPHPAARPQLRRRGARVRRRAVPRRQRVGPRGDARPRRAPAQHDQHRARVARAGGRGDRALRRRPALRPGPAADHGRVPAGQPQVLADLRRRGRGRSAARRPHRRPRAALGHGLAVLLPRGARRLRQRDGRGDDELHRRGRLRALRRPAGRVRRGRHLVGRPAHVVDGRRVVGHARRRAAPRPQAVRATSASTSGSRPSRSRSPTIPSSSCRRSSSPA